MFGKQTKMLKVKEEILRLQKEAQEIDSDKLYEKFKKNVLQELKTLLESISSVHTNTCKKWVHADSCCKPHLEEFCKQFNDEKLIDIPVRVINGSVYLVWREEKD